MQADAADADCAAVAAANCTSRFGDSRAVLLAYPLRVVSALMSCNAERQQVSGWLAELRQQQILARTTRQH